MTNTKFRKRALLSSVAMLLVALVALGSATFAWFTANPNATASGFKMRTTAAAGLVISTETDSRWTHNAVLRATGTGDNTVTDPSPLSLQPASQEQSTPANFWTVPAAAADGYEAGSDPMTAGVQGADYYAEKVYFRLSDGSDATANASKVVKITGVTITPTAGVQATESMKNAVRVSIADASGTLLGTWALSTGGAHGTLTTAAKTAGDFTPDLAATATGLSISTNQTALPATANTSKYVTVYVYLDGQDDVCYSDKVGTVNATEIISGVQVDFTLV